jgi:hypothetical protein
MDIAKYYAKPCNAGAIFKLWILGQTAQKAPSTATERHANLVSNGPNVFQETPM